MKQNCVKIPLFIEAPSATNSKPATPAPESSTAASPVHAEKEPITTEQKAQDLTEATPTPAAPSDGEQTKQDEPMPAPVEVKAVE